MDAATLTENNAAPARPTRTKRVLAGARNAWGQLNATHKTIFWIVAALKLGAGAYFGSRFTNQLFIPFIDYFVRSGFANPWAHFHATAPEAFPYSGAMLAVLSLPYAILSPLLPAGQITWLNLLAFRLPLFFSDLVIAGVLVSWFPTRVSRILWLYWCAPIVFYINYVHGQIDGVPTAFLLVALAMLLREHFWLAGLCYGLAIASKFHVVAIAPLIYYYLSRRSFRLVPLWPSAIRFSVGAVIPVLLAIVPFAFNPAFRAMVFGSGESRAVFAYAINVTPDLRFYVCPAVLLVLFAKFLSYSKTNRDVFLLFCGLVFTSLVLLLPPAPGWYFWSMPFIVYFYIRQFTVSSVSYWALSAMYLIYFLAKDYLAGRELLNDYQFPMSILFTGLQSMLAFVTFFIYRAGVRSNAVYRTSQKPILIGIGGNSSSGKHTLAKSLIRAFGEREVLQVNGDDYHKWPRGHEGWKVVTHLNPQGNDLHTPVQHIEELKRGDIVSKPHYDHKTGMFTQPETVDPKRFNLFVGLHPFYLPRMRAIMDLKIFMETEEAIGVAWKVERDSSLRGYTKEQVKEQIEKRKPDGHRFIDPQKEFADLVIRYAKGYSLPLSVEYTISSDIDCDALIAKLTQTSSLRVERQYLEDLLHQKVVIEGTILASRLDEIASELLPNLEELTGNRPEWEADLRGINQLLILLVLSHALSQEKASPSALQRKASWSGEILS